MTSIHIDHRISRLETRVTDIEDTHGASLYKLTRASAGSRIETGRLINGVNQVSRGMALVMERLGIPPIPFAPITHATEGEIDAALEAEL